MKIFFANKRGRGKTGGRFFCLWKCYTYLWWGRKPRQKNRPPVFWKAYKKAASIDLDSNGGLGVYPNDIRASSLVTVVNDQWKT